MQHIKRCDFFLFQSLLTTLLLLGLCTARATQNLMQLSISDSMGELHAIDITTAVVKNNTDIKTLNWRAPHGSVRTLCTEGVIKETTGADTIDIEWVGKQEGVNVYRLHMNSYNGATLIISGGQWRPCRALNSQPARHSGESLQVVKTIETEIITDLAVRNLVVLNNKTSMPLTGVSGSSSPLRSSTHHYGGDDGMDDTFKPGRPYGFMENPDSGLVSIDIFPAGESQISDNGENNHCPTYQLIIRHGMVETVISYDCKDLAALSDQDANYQSLIKFFLEHLSEQPEAADTITYLLTSVETKEIAESLETPLREAYDNTVRSQLVAFLQDSNQALLEINSGSAMSQIPPGVIQCPLVTENQSSGGMQPADAPADQEKEPLGKKQTNGENPAEGAGQGSGGDKQENITPTEWLVLLKKLNTHWFQLGQAFGVSYSKLLFIKEQQIELWSGNGLKQMLEEADKQGLLNSDIVLWFLSYQDPSLGFKLIPRLIQTIPEQQRAQKEAEWRDIVDHHTLPNGYQYIDNEGQLSPQGVFLIARNHPATVEHIARSLNIQEKVFLKNENNDHVKIIHLLEFSRDMLIPANQYQKGWRGINAVHILSLLVYVNPASVGEMIKLFFRKPISQQAHRQSIIGLQHFEVSEGTGKAKTFAKLKWELSEKLASIQTYEVMTTSADVSTNYTWTALLARTLLASIEHEWYEFGHAMGLNPDELELIGQMKDSSSIMQVLIGLASSKGLITNDLIVWYLSHNHGLTAEKIIPLIAPSKPEQAMLMEILEKNALPQPYKYLDNGILTNLGMFFLAIKNKNNASGIENYLHISNRVSLKNPHRRILTALVDAKKKARADQLSPLNVLNIIMMLKSCDISSALQWINLIDTSSMTKEMHSRLVEESQQIPTSRFQAKITDKLGQ